MCVYIQEELDQKSKFQINLFSNYFSIEKFKLYKNCLNKFFFRHYSNIIVLHFFLYFQESVIIDMTNDHREKLVATHS